MSNIFKKAGKTTAELAREVAKKVAREPVETLKTAMTPAKFQEKGSPNIIQEAISATSPNASENVNEQEINAKAKKRLEELEQEIQKIRQERYQRVEEWNKQQQELMGQGKSNEQEQPIIEPQTKKKRGFMGFMKKKQGTKELGKQMSG